MRMLTGDLTKKRKIKRKRKKIPFFANDYFHKNEFETDAIICNYKEYFA